MAHQNDKKPTRPDLLRALIDLRDSEMEAAKHLFIVCGEPSTEEGFLQAWAKEDAKWLTSFLFLRGLIASMEKMGIEP